MSAIDQLALELPGLAAPPPEVLAGLNEHDQAAVLDVLNAADRQDGRTDTDRRERGTQR